MNYIKSGLTPRRKFPPLLRPSTRLSRAAALVLACFMLVHFYCAYTGNTTFEACGEVLENAVRSLSLRYLPWVVYFNGALLQSAVQSSSELDELSRALTAQAAGEAEKAYILYEWVCGNMNYDFEKVQLLTQDSLSVSSGTLDAYATGSGVCFDYSCLYISMCRAAGIKVRFISGQGLSGGVWDAHVWNQVFDPAEGRWISVDTTFGSTGGNYFDRADFELDHTRGIVLGEW